MSARILGQFRVLSSRGDVLVEEPVECVEGVHDVAIVRHIKSGGRPDPETCLDAAMLGTGTASFFTLTLRREQRVIVGLVRDTPPARGAWWQRVFNRQLPLLPPPASGILWVHSRAFIRGWGLELRLPMTLAMWDGRA